MLKKISTLALILSSLLFTNAEANSYPRPNCNSCCESEWNFYGDWLYWKARRSRLDYAVPLIEGSGLIVPTGEIVFIEPSYKSGFRLGFLYECGPFFYDFFYTRFHHSYSNTTSVTFPNTLATTEPGRGSIFSSAEGIWSINYDTVDLLVGFAKNRCFCIESYFFGGLKLAFIDQKFTTNNALFEAEEFVITYNQKLNMNSYGVDVGFGANYEFWRHFSFFGRTSVDFLIGDFHRTFFQDNFGSIQGDLNDHFWNMVTAVNLLFGINYVYSFSNCWCGNIGLAIGYEFHQYFGMPDYMSYSRATGLSFAHDLQNLSLDGLFVRFSVGF